MILGLLAIAFTALLNASLVLLPMVAVIVLSAGIIKFLTFLKIRNDTVDNWVAFLLLPAGVFFAAALQLHLWRLEVGQEPWRWTCAAATYLLGSFVLLMWQMPMTKSPLERSWAANRFALGGLVMLATLGVSFQTKSVHEFVLSSPKRTLTFVIGETPK